MSQTAHSRHFNRELDVRQLLKLRGVISTLGQAEYEVTPQERAWMRADLVCPSCRCEGASIVRSDVKSARGNTRQAHFRFTGADGLTAHAPGCDFYALADAGGIQSGVDVSFMADDRDTRIVRELVCRAIASGQLARTDIFAMRTWFLDRRAAGSFTVRGAPAMADWLYDVRRLVDMPVRFEPDHAALPGFSAHAAARRDLAFRYREFREAIPRLHLDAPARDRTRRILERHPGQALVSMEGLRPQYDATLQLARLMGEYGALPLPKPITHYSADSRIPEALLAFAAALLFVSGWDVAAALGRFAILHAAPPPEDLTAANVMGLNPFHDFVALEMARFISTIPSDPGRTWNLGEELAETRQKVMAG